MGTAINDAPISELSVVFKDIKDQYSNIEDIVCNFTITNSYKIQRGDRIAIFEMGWKSLKHHLVYEWVRDHTKPVTFRFCDLPNDCDKFYQFCYISCENVVHGISTLFQISPLNTSFYETMSCGAPSLTGFSPAPQRRLEDKEKTIAQLTQENILLKDIIKEMHQPKVNNTKYDRDIEQLKHMTQALQNALIVTQKEVECLKTQVLLQSPTKIEAVTQKKGPLVFLLGKERCEDLPSIPPFPNL